jgi:GNAT superfamily N-acetyltransferase
MELSLFWLTPIGVRFVSLPLGFTDVPDGKIASIVTHLQMLAPAPLRHGRRLEGVELKAVQEPTASWYKDLFARVGANDWLWFSRLKLTDIQLEAIIRDPNVDTYTLTYEGDDEALLELDFRIEGSCELAFFGLTRNLVGTDAGRFLMNRAIDLAWSHDISCFHVHTCTMDHPSALPFYLRSGFVPFLRQVEIVDDPRISGLLPETAAPHVPLIR